MNERDEKAAADFLRKRGWGLVPPDQYLIDLEPGFLELWEKVRPFTMTSIERAYALYRGIVYLGENNIPGDFVECGVWRGGSCLLICLALRQLGISGRRIFLYDTFSGMPQPGEEDVIAWNGMPVSERIARSAGKNDNPFAGWAVDRDEVERNLLEAGCPGEDLVFVPGKVEDTLKTTLPESAALLRLDTDWYSSTKAELEALYPRLVSGGVLFVDDYGHFRGARKAVDEYFASGIAPGVRPGEGKEPPVFRPFLGRIDYTGRLGIKP